MKPRRNFKIVLIALLLAGAVAGFGYGMTATAKTGEAQAAATAAVSAGSPMVPGNFSDLAEKVRAGVVNIQVSKKVKNAGFERFGGNPFGDRNPFGDFFGPFGGCGTMPREETAGGGLRVHHEQGRIHPDQQPCGRGCGPDQGQAGRRKRVRWEDRRPGSQDRSCPRQDRRGFGSSTPQTGQFG